jgi:hypothetical protein
MTAILPHNVCGKIYIKETEVTGDKQLSTRMTAVTATSLWPKELVSYPEKHFCNLAHWLRNWRVTINVSKSATVLFIKTARRI